MHTKPVQPLDELQKQNSELHKYLRTLLDEPHVIRATVEAILAHQTLSDVASEQGDMAGSCFETDLADTLQNALETCHIALKEDESDSEIIHVYQRDKQLQTFSVAEWQWMSDDGAWPWEQEHTEAQPVASYIERFVPPSELRVGDLFYPHGDLPTHLSEFKTIKSIWAKADGTFDIYIDDQACYRVSSYGLRTLTLAPHGNIRPANALAVGDRCMPAYTNNDFAVYREVTLIANDPSGVLIQFADGNVCVHPEKLYQVEIL